MSKIAKKRICKKKIKIQKKHGYKHIDGVGKSTWEKSLKCVKPRGYCIYFGNASGPVPAIDPLMLTKQGSVYLQRPSLVSYIADPNEFKQRSDELYTWIAENKVIVFFSFFCFAYNWSTKN